MITPKEEMKDRIIKSTFTVPEEVLKSMVYNTGYEKNLKIPKNFENFCTIFKQDWIIVKVENKWGIRTRNVIESSNLPTTFYYLCISNKHWHVLTCDKNKDRFEKLCLFDFEYTAKTLLKEFLDELIKLKKNMW